MASVGMSRSDQLGSGGLARPNVPPVVATGLARPNVPPVVALHAVDGAEFRAWFVPKFAEWLRGNFRRPEDVAAAFGVRSSTAWNWWNGDNRATGDAVGRMFVAVPQAQAWFLAQWEGR